ncbi:ABC transporter ATP-binding protein [Rosettibacter firmus]|uniref:ABC transporter ATP-binding protein n=1 Tax=Rosettibacter firmus TaxID=3111522 RepID=UPI00336C122A
MYSIEVNNLTKRFDSFTAVDNISFNVREGEIFGFLGANGAGKSTTIRMLCGILEPTSGDAIVGGYSIVHDPDRVKLNIGYMSQKFSLYNDLTVEENIEFFGSVYGLYGRTLKEKKDWVLKISYLKGSENILTGSLPGGIKQRLALGISVIHKPKIVFLDEPTSGVDPIYRRNFWELINELSQEGITVVVTTHYLEEAEYCNNIILIDSGKIIAQGSSKQLKTNYIKNPILELESKNILEVIEILEKQDFVSEVSLFGNNLHIITNEKFSNISQLNSLLKEKNITPERITTITPTLEDVFIHLLEMKKDEEKINEN